MSGEAVGRKRAEAVRAALGLGDAPVTDMIEVLEMRSACDVSIEVMPDGVDGMVAEDPVSGRRVVAVATTDLPHRQRMTIAHELGHLELGTLREHASCGERTPAEIAADAFARHLLLPTSAVARMSAERAATDVADALSDVVRRYMVGSEVATIQMRDAGRISQAEQTRLRQWSVKRLASRYGWTAEFESWVAESGSQRPPRRLLKRAIDAYVAGMVPVAAVAAVYGIGVPAMSQLLESGGINPEPIEVEWFELDA